MSKLKVFYILSFIILGVLTGFVVLKPMAIGEKYSEVQRGQLLETKDQWIIELDLINHEKKDVSYTIDVLVDEELCTESILISPGQMFKYTHYIYKDRLKATNIPVTVYKEGKALPFQELTYYLK